MFAECRFAFRESLKEWPDNGAAIEGIRRATAAMVEYELRLGDAKAAATLLSGLEQPPAELRQRVEEAQLHKVAEARRVSEIVRDNDSATGARTRVLLGMIMGLTLDPEPAGPQPLAAATSRGLSRETHLDLIYSTGAFLLVGIGFAWWARDSMTKTKLNRQLMFTVVFTMMSQMVMNLVCGIKQIDCRDHHGAELLPVVRHHGDDLALGGPALLGEHARLLRGPVRGDVPAGVSLTGS
jgi:hypothetical protein